MTHKTPDSAAAAIAPGLAATARNTHELGLTTEAVAVLKAVGLLSLCQNPGEAWGAHIAAARILARRCATTAWIVTHSAEANRMIALLPADARMGLDQAFGTLGDSSDPIEIERKGAAAIVSGRWPFVPGAGFADWLVLRGPTSTGRVAILVPRTAVGSAPLDHQGGLRGCGFHAVTADRVEVPAHRVIALPAADVVLQRAAILGAILGGAEGGYADYLAMTKKRVSGTGGGPVAKMTPVQIRLAEAEADIAAAAESVSAIVTRLASGSVDDETAVRLARDGAVVAHRCLQAVTLLVHQMGALGLAEFNPVQRHYRDLRVMATDARVNWDTCLAGYGRHLLGVPESGPLPQAAE